MNRLALKLALAGAFVLVPAGALADVKAGVEAWQRGDYSTAVAEWQGPASQGDADAQFNLAQAYRLGRGVQQDMAQAEALYAAAAEQGHLKAADNLGLLMFQDGRRESAMPYVLDAAQRGDPRAQYLLGIAHFNGDLVARDWERAYALVTLANSAGLPQAANALQQMDSYIPLEQRQSAQVLAPQIKREADARRASRMAAEDLGDRGGPIQASGSLPDATAAARAARIPRPIEQTTVPPSVTAAQNAIAEAARVTGTESPAEAGATFAHRRTPQAQPVAQPVPTQAASVPVTRPQAPPPRAAVAPQSRPEPAPAPAPAPQRGGPWKVQLGAFAVDGNAERLWSRLSGRSELAGATRILKPSGRVTVLQAGGFASRAEANAACAALKRSGQDCLVTQ